MKVSVVIVNYNVRHFLEICLHSVNFALKNIDAEIFVVDNHSQDGSVEMVREKFPQVILMANTSNVGFGKANNQAIRVAKGEYVLVLNPDTVMPEDFFTKILDYLDQHPDVGALGPRLIDGKGQFAPDSKKSFPTLSVAIFKTTGLNKIFSKSPYINKYYAVSVGENEVAEVEVLSGCCMMLRRSAIDKAGGAFDEDFFMYCEDVDLSYRLQKSGFKNIYFPKVDLIHYKGESTKKATLKYVRVFNDALIKFVKKHYTNSHARLFILFIHFGILLRAILAAIKNVFKALRMPLFDAFFLTLMLWGMHEFWVLHVKDIGNISTRVLLFTIPVYILIWLLSLYLNGAYDKPYRALRVTRGMVIGTVLNLAYFGLLSADFRYSRAVVIFTGISAGIGLVALHELLSFLGIYKLVKYDQLPKRALVISNRIGFEQTLQTLRMVHYAPEVMGRVAPNAEEEDLSIGRMENLAQLAKALGVQEAIYTMQGLTYSEVLRNMQQSGKDLDYKIHLPLSSGFVGSHSSHQPGELFTVDKRFRLGAFSQRRNKRFFDLILSTAFILGWPIFALTVKNGGGLWRNAWQVLKRKKTWVGYSIQEKSALKELPEIKTGVLPTYVLQENFELSPTLIKEQDYAYAEHYSAPVDWNLVSRNWRFLGRK